MSQTFFEGPEKKVEFVVNEGSASLRSYGEARWRRVVEAAGAQVLSTLSNEHCDAFLLSESSLFVFEDYAVMITCGRTRLVDAVREILTFVPAESIAFLVYERKNEHFPEHQPTTFYEDAQQLNEWLPGRAFRFGGGHWHHIKMFCTSKPYTPEKDDPTIEVLMHGIEAAVAERFASLPKSSSTSIASELGLDRILPGFTVSEHVFDPVGYSLNALSDQEYFTVHVTPDAAGSYVSFETNHRPPDVSQLVGALSEVFRPAAFDVVAFQPEGEPELSVPGYGLADHVSSELSGYVVSFFQFHRPPTGPRPAYEFRL